MRSAADFNGNGKDSFEWWDEHAKVRIQRFFKEEGRETAKERRHNEQFYYTCIYELLREHPGDPHMSTRLKYFREKIDGSAVYQGK